METLEKEKMGYTKVYNILLNDKNLSLRDIGLLVKIISFSKDWTFSVNGLCSIVKDGKESVQAGIKNLEKFGYLVRQQVRGKNGKFEGYKWDICLEPKNSKANTIGEPCEADDMETVELSIAELPSTEKPLSENPSTDNQPQYITKELNTKKINNKNIKCESELPTEHYESLCKEFSKGEVDYHIARIKNNGYKGCMNYDTIRQWCLERKDRKTVNKPAKSAFHNFEQREYDFVELERLLVHNA